MLALILSVSLAILISAFCSLSEAALYSVSWSFIERMRKEKGKTGEVLFNLRSNVERPITAILTLNTLANTAGAAVAGAAAVAVYGPEYLWLFTLLFTALVLVFGEIFPKTIGVVYNRAIVGPIAKPLLFLIFSLAPVIWVGGRLARLVRPKRAAPLSTEDDLRAVVSLTRREGVIKP